MLGDQVGMLAKAVAGTFDLDHAGVVQEPVEQRGGHDRVAEHGAPLGEALVRGEDHGALLVAGVHEVEEEVGALRVDGDVADLVELCCAQHNSTYVKWPVMWSWGARYQATSKLQEKRH